MNTKKWYLLLSAFLILTFFSSFTLQALTLYIDDNANVISKDTDMKLSQLLADTEKEENFHVQAIVLPTFYGKAQDKVISAYYQNMIVNSKVDRAALLIIVLDKEFVQIVTTPNIVRVFNVTVVKDIVANVKKQMLEKNYDEMLRVGVAGILHYYKEKAAKSTHNSSLNILRNMGGLLVIAVLIFYAMHRRQADKKPKES